MAIVIPRKPKQPDQGPGPAQTLGAIGTIAGGIVGSVVPGAGTMAGAGVGGSIGSTVGTMADMSKPKEEMKAEPDLAVQSGGDDSAMSRRLNSMQDNKLADVVEAGKALNNMPPEVQDQYRPMLASTYAALRRGGGQV